MRKVKANSLGIARRTVARVASLETLAADWRPGLAWLVRAHSRHDVAKIDRLRAAGVGDLFALVSCVDFAGGSGGAAVVGDLTELVDDDVVAVMPGAGGVQVLYRVSDVHHTVFLTNRCNSRCVMCSQPPTTHDDSWLIDEAKQIALHVSRAPGVVGFTGGEPLLLGEDLGEVLRFYLSAMPATRFEVLSNGRSLSDPALAESLLKPLPNRVCWMVPLYGHADLLHDDIVQSQGAFDETIAGLLNLQDFGQSVQLRVVLIEPVLQALPELCSFVAKNLPFVREVALMGCEPVGLALANRAACEVDIRQWEATLSSAIGILRRAELPVLLMNIPLCGISADLRSLAQRSISDWKQVFAPECAGCSVRADCSGLFAWHKKGWRPTVLRPIVEETVS